MKTEKVTAEQGDKMPAALREYLRASLAYQRDCNLRLGIKATDAKRRRLKRANDQAFTKLLKARTGTALSFASDWWWDEEWLVATERGRVGWECARYTGRGGSVRLARLDNKQCRSFIRYVKPETKMRLVQK